MIDFDEIYNLQPLSSRRVALVDPAELARYQAIEKAAQSFMDNHDSDWWQECDDWKDTDEYSDEFPIGLLRNLAAALKS